MLKQLAGRNQRTKGFKVKNSLQIFLFIAGCLWVLYQLKHSYDKKNEYEENSRETLEKLQFEHETPKLGRKGLQPWIKKPEDLIDDAEETMPEKIKVRRGGGNGEMNGHDQDKMEEEDSEEVEDLIDEEDKERMEEIEEEEGDDMVKNIEDIISLKDKSHDDEENENGASRVMMRKTQSTGAEFEGGFDISEKTEMMKQRNKIMSPRSEVLVPRTESIPKVEDKVTVVHGFLQTVLSKGKYYMPEFSDSLPRMEMTEPGSYNNVARVSKEATGSLCGTSADENEKASDGGIGEEVIWKRAQAL